MALSDGCATGFAGGDGSVSDPYQITSVSQFKELEDCSSNSANFRVMNDIDFGGSEPGTPITEFIGTLDGDGKTLSNLRINSGVQVPGSYMHSGVFAFVSSGASIQDLKIDGLEITSDAKANVSGFVGRARDDFDLSNIFLTGVEQSSLSLYSGGVIGLAELSQNSVVSNISVGAQLDCSTSETLSACGGVVGYVSSIPNETNNGIRKVFADVNFAALGANSSSDIGGLAGMAVCSAGSPSLLLEDIALELAHAGTASQGDFGGLVGAIECPVSNEIDVIANRVSVVGDIPEARFGGGGGLVGNTLEDRSGSEPVFSPREVVIKADYPAGQEPPGANFLLLRSSSFAGSGTSAKDELNLTNADIYHDSTQTADSGVYSKISTANRSDISSYPSLDLSTDLFGNSDWYVQGLDGVGELVSGYPVPRAVAAAGLIAPVATFDPNGGSGNAEGRVAVGGDQLEAIANSFTNGDLPFQGWNTQASGGGSSFAPGDTLSFSSNTTYFAQWHARTPAPYSGPLITSVGNGSSLSAAGETVEINGQRLGSVTKATIDGKEVEIASVTADSFQIVIPDGIAQGTYDLKIESSIGNLTYLDGITITRSTNSTEIDDSSASYGEMSAWTKRISDTQVKVYVKFPTVGEKVRIGHQTGGSGSYESVYAKTTSIETMEGLRVVPGVGTYIVRTIDLEDINRIRVTIGDEKLVQVRYNN